MSAELAAYKARLRQQRALPAALRQALELLPRHESSDGRAAHRRIGAGLSRAGEPAGTPRRRHASWPIG